MKNWNKLQLLEWAALLSLLILAAGYYVQPASDVDFWWHLASGRYISTSGSIPAVDPFGMYDATNYWGQTVLKGQWLGQLLIYAAYAIGGFDGVVVLRALLLLLCLVIAWIRLRREGSAAAPALVILFLVAMTLRGHLGERPQLLSFLFFGLLFLAAEYVWSSGRKRLVLALPLLLVLWANCHPGVILGAAALSLWLVLGVAEESWRLRRLEPRQWGLPGAAIVGSWLATLATPNGLTSYEYLLRLEGDPIKDRVSEYQSPLALLAELARAPFLPWYFVLVLLAVPALIVLLRRGRLRESAVIIFVLVISLSSYRYIPFFVLYVAPFLTLAGAKWMDAWKRWRGLAAAAIAAGAGALLIYGAGQGSLFRGGVDERQYPVELVDRLRQTGLQGRAFNTLNWGGYLTWNLGTQVTPFIDGRLIDSTRTRPYTHVLWMTPEGQDYFEKANFDMAIIPYRSAQNAAQGNYPLAGYLMRHPGWQLVTSDDKGMLFSRR